MAAPSNPTNLTILSSRNPGSPVGPGPDVVLQWTQSVPGGAPIAGYRVYVGIDPNAFGNYLDYPIANYPIDVYATYTAIIPGGTMPNATPSVVYYFAVQAFDDGSEVDIEG